MKGKIPLKISDFYFGEVALTFKCPHCGKKNEYPISGHCEDNQANNFQPMETNSVSHSVTLYPDCSECGEEIKLTIKANFFVTLEVTS